MSPLEAAVRTVCEAAGAQPDTWRGFLHFARTGLNELMRHMPPEQAAWFRAFLDQETPE